MAGVHSSSGETVSFQLQITQPQAKASLLDRALLRGKPVVALSLVATTSSGKESILFQTSVKVQQVRNRQAAADSADTAKNSKYIPLSLKVQTHDSLSSSDIVYVKVKELAQKTGLESKINILKSRADDQDPKVNAAAVSAFLQDRISLTHEKVYVANSLHDKLNTPINSEVLTSADAALSKMQRLSTGQLAELQHNDSFIALRTAGSNSITKGASHRDRWMQASEAVRELAAANKPLTMSILCDLHKTIYQQPPSEPEKIPGELRTNAVFVGSMFGATYLHPDFIPQEMEKLLAWVEESIPKGNPIVVAGLAYQSMVSFHPFCDANGRTSRLVMDYILQRCGLPPACLGNDVDVAIFGTQSAQTSSISKTPEQAIQCVLEGVKKSYQVLQGE